MAIDKNGVSVPAQSKDLDTTRVTTTYGLVHRQVISIADPETPTSYVTLTGSSLNVNITTASIAVTAASLPLPTGAATSALQTTGNSSLSSIDGKITAVNTGAVVVSSSALPTGAATQTTLASIDAKFSALGQTTMSASVPVVLASNHSDIVTKKSASSYAHLNSTGTTTIKSGAGILRRVVINTKGSASNTFTIYDNTSGSGTVIAAIDTVNGVSGHFEYNVAFSTGLTVVDATGTSADITVIYE